LEIDSSKAIIVVAPQCPAGLIEELIEACILPTDRYYDILLSPENFCSSEHLVGRNTFCNEVNLLTSGATSFFSRSHLAWIWKNLKTSNRNLLLIYRTPYEDFKTAIISLITLFLSYRIVTLLFATPEAIINKNGKCFSDKWIFQDINPTILLREFFKIICSMPLFALYLILIWGLILKSRLTSFFPFPPGRGLR